MKKTDILYCGIYLLLTLAGLTMIKMASQSEKALFRFFSYPISIELIIGVLCYGISFLMYVFVISRMTISLTLPVLAGINSVSIVLIGILIFHEKLSVGQLFGVGVVIIGIVLIGVFSK